MVITGEPPASVVGTLQGLERQTSGHWSLMVVLPAAWRTNFTSLLTVSGLSRSSQRVRTLSASDDQDAGAVLTLGLEALGGSAVALIFPGDVWPPDAVAQLGGALGEADAVYADEDRVTDDGHHIDPRLKPAYSPDFLLAQHYVGRPFAFGPLLIDRVLGSGPLHASEFEHDLALRACEAATRVTHVPEVLCHRSDGGEPQPQSDGSHVAAALERRGDRAAITAGPVAGSFRLVRTPAPSSSASVIIPFRDEPRLLRACIESIDATRGEHRVDYVLMDNGSEQPETATLIDRLGERADVTVLADHRPFNWAALNNAAAVAASGDILVFLNNDIVAQLPGWLDALVAQASRADVGAVGARLLYPDRRLQHCGTVIGLGGAAGHILVGLEDGEPGYLNMAVLTRECAAVTGACLATRREVFAALDGFDESLGVDLNDVDYCLRAQRSGLRVIFEPAAELIHHESPSRGTAGDVRDIIHFIDRWQASIESDDPYLNSRLTRVDSTCRLRGPDERAWWRQWHSTLPGR
jgi:O-antigen biosynthesis protein